jgi:hypothetical protein
MPGTLASLALRSVSLSRDVVRCRGKPLPFPLAFDAWVAAGLLRFCRASAAVWSSEKKHRLLLSMHRWHGFWPEHCIRSVRPCMRLMQRVGIVIYLEF